MRRRVVASPVAHLGTLGPGGRPHLVPVCFAIHGDVFYSAVDQKPKTTKNLRRLDNIRKHPEVEVLVDHYEQDWSALWWVRLRGTGRLVDDPEEITLARELLAEKYMQYRRDPPLGSVLAVKIETWSGWSP
jgi:PPOX class probable F420-dependent enzyme